MMCALSAESFAAAMRMAHRRLASASAASRAAKAPRRTEKNVLTAHQSPAASEGIASSRILAIITSAF